jgi:hypothetical protein
MSNMGALGRRLTAYGKALVRVSGVVVAVTAVPLLARPPQPAQLTEIRVHAGKHARRNTPVVVSVAGGLPRGVFYEIRDSSGLRIPIQIDGAQRARFIVPSLEAGEERVYTIHSGLQPPPPGSTSPAQQRYPIARVASEGSDLHVTVDKTPVVTYIGGKGRLPAADIKPAYQRGGYLHPVRTPSGRIVTDDYPSDHYHQHGVMMAWTSAVFEDRKTDFWNMGNSLARVDAVGIEMADPRSGPVFAAWLANHEHVDLTSGAPKTVLREQWQVRVYALRDLHLFDIDVHQSMASQFRELQLPEYHYGGMAVRGAASLRGDPGNAIVLTSEGKDRIGADASRARWAYIGGRVDGAQAGMAMLGHPDNFRAPEPLRVHPNDPYICFAPSRLGPWSITTATPHVVKYRFVATDGPPDAALLDRLWRDYAEPPTVTVK